MHSAIEVLREGSLNIALDASKDWHRWCRLCAKADTQNINIFLKDEHIVTNEDGIERNKSGLSIAIGKYFDVEMKHDGQLPVHLCTDCFLLITSLISFNERVVKVQKMYLALQHFHANAVIDFHALRLKYGVSDDEGPHEFMYRPLAEIQLCEEKLKIHDYKENSFVEEVDTEITLKEPRTSIEIKKENSNDLTPLTDEDICDFVNEDAEGEDPFGSDVELNNNDDEVNENSMNCSSKLKKHDEAKSEAISPYMSSIERMHTNINENKNRLKLHPSKIEKNSLQNVAVPTTDVERDEKEKPHTCVECSKVFKRLSNYRSHMERKHAKTDAVPRFVCSECNSSFNTRTQLNHHHTIKHLPITERRIVPCPYCEQKFPTKTYVATHIKFVHMNERSFICEECGEAVRSKGQLKQHMLTHTDYAPFECEVCKKCFKNQERLKNHMETHNPNKHVCDECGLQLNSRITLNRHLLVHSDVMQHKCDYCGRAFKRAKALKNHLILHTGLKPYACDFCDRTFANGSNCRTHKRKAHPEELAAQEASGEKSYAKNIPKLAVLKSVTQAAENLAPVVSKQSGNFAFGKKPKIPPDSVGTISRKQRKLHNESVTSTSTSNEPIGGGNENSNKPIHSEDIQFNSKNCNDNNNIDNKNISTIDNIYSQLMKQTGSFRIAPTSTINPMHLDIKRSRSEESSPAGNNSCIDIDITNVIAQQQQQLSQQFIEPSQQSTIPSVVQSFYRC